MTITTPTWLAYTHRPIFRGLAAESAVESANSIPESADSTADFVIVIRLPVLNMFNISTPIQSADFSRSTIAVGGWQIGLVGMGLEWARTNGRYTRSPSELPSLHLA